MFRRTFLKLTTGLIGASALGGTISAEALANSELELSFWVAGVRFHQPDAGTAPGDRVYVVAGTYRRERCYEVFAGKQRIGYVPRKVVAALGRTTILEGRLSTVDPNAVPWRRYKVVVSANDGRGHFYRMIGSRAADHSAAA